MHSIVLLTTAIALLGAYLQSTEVPLDVAQQSIAAKVIRSTPIHSHTDTLAKTSPQRAMRASRATPLDLQLPNFRSLDQSYMPADSANSTRFKPQIKGPEVRLNAELVFDAEEGESITGGKVNIQIPFG